MARHRALLGDRAVWEHLPESSPDVHPRHVRDLITHDDVDPGHEVGVVEV